MQPSWVVRPLADTDRAQWEELWAAYLRFYREEVPAVVSEATFARLRDRVDGLAGFVAEEGGGRLAGFAHLVLHPSTWSNASYCYLEDLFVAATARRKGVARTLIERVYSEADARGADRVYWQTQSGNAEARALYDRLAEDTGFVVYARR